MSDSFKTPRKTARWAREEIQKLHLAVKSFVNDNSPTPFREMDLATGEEVHGVVFATPSDEMERRAYRIVNDLRNALDQATFAASFILKGTKGKRTNFPFGEHAHDFETALAAERGHYRDIPAELHPILRSFNPFWPTRPGGGDGNTLLRALAYVANPNKHQIPIEASADIGTMGIYTMRGIALFKVQRMGQNKVQLFRQPCGAPFEFHADIEQKVVFSDVKGLEGRRIIATFNEIAAIVDGIIDGIEAETIRLFGERK